MCRIPSAPARTARRSSSSSSRAATTGPTARFSTRAPQTPSSALRCRQQVPGSRRLSQRISEGDGIAIIVCVDDAAGARDAEAQGAKAVAVTGYIDGIRDATTLPLLWIGAGTPSEADAVRIRPEDDP